MLGVSDPLRIPFDPYKTSCKLSSIFSVMKFAVFENLLKVVYLSAHFSLDFQNKKKLSESGLFQPNFLGYIFAFLVQVIG